MMSADLRFLILLSYEVAASLEEVGRRGMWYPSERNRAVREKLVVVEEVGDGTY